MCCYFEPQRASLTNEAAFRQRTSGWKLNDNEYKRGVPDYATTEMEMQKRQDYWDACLHGTLLLPGFCLCAIQLALSLRVHAWQRESSK